MSEMHQMTGEAEVDAEDKLLAAAIAESDTDPRSVPHAAVADWLLRIANGKFDASHPVPSPPTCPGGPMTPDSHLSISEEQAAYDAALVAAVAEARADPRAIPHEEMAVWLRKLANGERDATPPIPRIL